MTDTTNASVYVTGTINAYVYGVYNKTTIVIFKTMESAQRYLSQFPPSISGGMTISAIAVFD